MYLLVLTCSLHILRIRIYLLVCTCSLHILRMYLRVCICSLYILRMYLLVLNLFLAYSSYILACMIVYSDTRQVKSFSPIMTSSYFLITSSMYLSASLVLSFHWTVAGIRAVTTRKYQASLTGITPENALSLAIASQGVII